MYFDERIASYPLVKIHCCNVSIYRDSNDSFQSVVDVADILSLLDCNSCPRSSISPDNKKLTSERLGSLGIMGAQLTNPLKPFDTIKAVIFERFQGDPQLGHYDVDRHQSLGQE